MKIICKTNDAKNLPENALDPRPHGWPKREAKFDLVLGQTYVVYGMTVELSHIWYFVANYDDTSHPNWYPFQLFDVIDGRISRYWHYSVWHREEIDKSRPIFAFKAWVEIPGYWGRLVDGHPEEIRVFRKYKELMDLEFSDASVGDTAKALGDGWVMCSKEDCQETWDASKSDALIRCPKCKTIENNPHYKVDTILKSQDII